MLALSPNLVALQISNLKESDQFRVEFGQAQNLHHLFVNPFVIGNRVDPAADKKRLQELPVRVVEPVQTLKV